jgi:CHASE2 domain-containing sensor protein
LTVYAFVSIFLYLYFLFNAMILHKIWQRIALWLGLGWGVLWGLVLSELSFTQQLDRLISDRLTRLPPPRIPPPEIFLVTISQSDLKAWGTTNESKIYSNLVNRLLDRGAAGVVLNLLPNWLQTSDHPNHPIKTLIQAHRDRLVVVLPTTSATQRNPPEWRSYEYLLPLTTFNEPLIPPKSILGFAEHEPEARQPQSLSSTARQANLTGQFTDIRNPNHTLALDSFALLSLKKFQIQPPFRALPSPIQIHFWGATGTFPALSAQSILSDRPPSLPIRNKIVLVGFSDIHNPDTFAVQSPFGDLMPGVEWQANVLASLLTHSYSRIAPLWLQGVVILMGGVLVSGWVVWGTVKSAHRRRGYWLFPLLLLGLFGLLSGALSWQHWILPLTLPLLTWVATGLSVLVCLRIGMQQELINQQQCELDRLHNVEQAAVISQAHKLLHRLASNIHDGPLQELKLVMDRLEFLQMNSATVEDLNPVLDQLAMLGNHLRQHLSATRAIALNITPELREGLDHGIATHLNHLIQSGALTLQVIQHLQPLEEPTLNSLWLEAREDIYRFFSEAIHNVICHAQPPHGTATQFQVNLEQQDSHCTLIIENDGDLLDPEVFEPTPQQRQRGGYGTKLMDTIAAELPQGSLQRIPLKTGGLRVQLTWEQCY